MSSSVNRWLPAYVLIITLSSSHIQPSTSLHLLSPPGYTWKQLKYRQILRLVPSAKVTSSSARPPHLLVLLVFHRTWDCCGSDHWPVTEILKEPQFHLCRQEALTYNPTGKNAKVSLQLPMTSCMISNKEYFISSCRKLRHWPPVNSLADLPWKSPSEELFPLPTKYLGNRIIFGETVRLGTIKAEGVSSVLTC